MLSVLTGSFRSLGDELVRRLRARPALEPAMVVVPGGNVAGALRRALAAAGGAAAVRIGNFHSLALQLLEEARVAVRPAAEDAGEEELFRAFLRAPGAPERYRRLAERPGAAALLATVRDLRSAGAEPGLLREVKEELPEDARRLAELARLLELYGEFLERAGLTTRAAIAAQAARCVEGSRLAREVKSWAVYGFYEFLGEQRTLLDELSLAADVTLFFPWRDAPAWKYAERTKNEDLPGAQARRGGIEAVAEPPAMAALKTKPPKSRADAGGTVSRAPTVGFAVRATTFVTRLFDPAAGTKKGEPPVKVVSASGKGDELWYAVKKARDLHESEGIAWRDLAIVARTLEGRLGAAERAFRAECVPWWTAATRALAERPLAQAAALAARLALEGAYHMDVMEWFTSPLVRGPARPERWADVARALAIVSGDDWRRLEGARGADLLDAEGNAVAPAATVDAFAASVADLRAALEEAGRKKGWAAAARAWEAFLGERLDVASDEPAWRAVQDALRGLAALEGAAAAPDAARFAAAFRRALDGARLPAQKFQPDGVAFLDAMAARGRRFRVAILLGLNEREWPRIPREDPYLPDASRARVAATTGLPLRPKLEGVAEERLLFALTLDAADRVILVHRRVDDEGRKEAPSAYLDEVTRLVPRDKPVAVPRLPVKKFEHWAMRLTPPERRLHVILTGGRDADPAVVKARDLETYGVWTPYDVLSAPPEDWLKKVAERGFSPTGLETLATCPFKYWITRIAGIRLLDPLEAEADPAAREVGAVLHAALAKAGDGGDPVAIAKDIFRERAAKRPPLRWAVWEAAREAGLAALGRLWRQDRDERTQGKWKVHAAELDLPLLKGPDPLPGLHGRVDRVETRTVNGVLEFRVTDFKYVSGKKPWYESADAEKVEEKVLKEADAGVHVQLLVYARLVAGVLGKGAKFAGSHYYFFGPRIEPVRQGLNADPGTERLETLAPRLWSVAAGGQFVVVHDPETCARCDARTACRQGHYATRERALQDPRFAEFRAGRLGR